MRHIPIFSLFFATMAGASQAPGSGEKKIDDRKVMLSDPAPPKDPTLAAYGMYAENAPSPEIGEPTITRLPLELKDGDRIAFVGNTLLDRGGQFGYLAGRIVQGQ